MMKKRTALFAGTALLSLAAATALYAPCTGVTKDNYITAGGAYNLNNSTAGKLSAVFAGTDSFGAGGVPASEVDRIQFGAESARAAIADVGQVIDGTAPAIVGTEESNLASKAEAVRGLIDGIENVPGEHNIDAKLKNLAESLDGSHNLADAAGRRLLDKVNRIAGLIGTDGGSLVPQVEWARLALDGRPVADGGAATLNQAIANIRGGTAGSPANGFIGSDAVDNNGSGLLDSVNSVIPKLQLVVNLIAGERQTPVFTVADALIVLQGDGNQGIIGNPADINPNTLGTSMFTQLTAARDLIDASLNAQGNREFESIGDAIEANRVLLDADPASINAGILAIQGESGNWGGIIGTGVVNAGGQDGDTSIQQAQNIVGKLRAFLTRLDAELQKGTGLKYTPPANPALDDYTSLLGRIEVA